MDVVAERATAPPPYHAYATITGVFVVGLALSRGIARLLGRDPPEQTWLDLATLSAATFKAARTIVRDDLTSFIREPFVEGNPRDHEDERPVQTGGIEQAIGELVTCSRCIGTWAAAGSQRRRCSHRASVACSPGRSRVQRSTISCRRASPR